MAGVVRNYADVVATTLGGAGDPAVAELLDAGDHLDVALANPAQIDEALTRWTAATDALRDRLVAYVLGQVPVGALPAITPPAWRAPEGVTLDASVGPLGVHVQAPALLIADPRDAAAPPIVIGVLPPSALRVHLDAGPVVGDGGLTILPDGINGALALHLGAVEVAALASLRRVGQDPSFAAVLAAGFTPGIQLGLGFQLSRVGRVVTARSTSRRSPPSCATVARGRPCSRSTRATAPAGLSPQSRRSCRRGCTRPSPARRCGCPGSRSRARVSARSISAS